MSFERPLRGSCHCGRNRYIIFPQHATEPPRVLFNDRSSYSKLLAHPSQLIGSAGQGYWRRLTLPLLGLSHTGSPLSAYLRVPLEWYFSTALPFYPDETTSMISRVYPAAHEQRRFCGFCGTPLSYWSEEPRSEANYIQLALGSLFPEDLADLEDLGFIPSPGEEEELTFKDEDAHMRGHDEIEREQALTIRKHHEVIKGVPWLDTLTEGSRLGTLRHAKGGGENQSGTVKVEWEIVEWTADDESRSDTPRNGKRKLADRDSGSDVSAMEGVQQ